MKKILLLAALFCGLCNPSFGQGSSAHPVVMGFLSAATTGSAGCTTLGMGSPPCFVPYSTTNRLPITTSGAPSSGVTSFTGDGALLSNSASTDVVTATLGNAAANSVWGNATASSGAPSYSNSPSVLSLTTTTLTLKGNATLAGTTTANNLTITGTCVGCGAASINLGSITTANPSISGAPNSGFYTAGAGLVDVGIGGVKISEWASTGATLSATTTISTAKILGGNIDGTAIGATTSTTGVFTTATAGSFVPTGSAIPTDGYYLKAANISAIADRTLPVTTFTNPASAVNFLTHSGSATGAAPIISVGGTDTNGVGLGLQFTALTATATGNGGGFTFTGGNGFGSGTGGAFSVTGGTGTTAGGAITLTGGLAGAGNVGGTVTVVGGGGTGGTGGTAIVRGGPGTSGNGSGGPAQITGGAGVGGGTSGAVTIAGGAGSSLGVAGQVNITGGAGGAGASTDANVGALVSLIGGPGGTTNNVGGISKVVGGAGAGSRAGGDAQVTGGAGGATGAGGAVTITSGAGGATSGNSGDINLTVGSVISGTAGTIKLNSLTALPNITSDVTHTDSAICQDTTTHALYSGSGTLGVCLGTSSVRYKTNIHPLYEGLNQINALKPVAYYYKKGHGDNGTKQQYGFLAEDVVKVFPKLVALDKDGQPNSVDILGMVPSLIHAVQEQQKEIEALKKQLGHRK